MQHNPGFYTLPPRNDEMIELVNYYLLKLITLEFDIPYPLIVMINAINHSLIWIITFNIVSKCRSLKLRNTAMHVFLCTIGLMVLMTEGLMVRYEGNAFYYIFEGYQNIVHGLLQIAGSVLILVGIVHKYRSKKQHFNSTHSKAGISGCVFCIINIIFGFWTLFVPLHNNTIRKIHALWGLATYLICAKAQYTGYQTGFFYRNFVHTTAYMVFTLIIFFLSAFGPTKLALQNTFSRQ